VSDGGWTPIDDLTAEQLAELARRLRREEDSDDE
jgi:hypothetical protein